MDTTPMMGRDAAVFAAIRGCNGWREGADVWLGPWLHELEDEMLRLRRIESAAREVLLDVDRYARTHGPGPDRRLSTLRDALRGPTL